MWVDPTFHEHRHRESEIQKWSAKASFHLWTHHFKGRAGELAWGLCLCGRSINPSYCKTWKNCSRGVLRSTAASVWNRSRTLGALYLNLRLSCITSSQKNSLCQVCWSIFAARHWSCSPLGDWRRVVRLLPLLFGTRLRDISFGCWWP